MLQAAAAAGLMLDSLEGSDREEEHCNPEALRWVGRMERAVEDSQEALEAARLGTVAALAGQHSPTRNSQPVREGARLGKERMLEAETVGVGQWPSSRQTAQGLSSATECPPTRGVGCQTAFSILRLRQSHQVEDPGLAEGEATPPGQQQRGA